MHRLIALLAFLLPACADYELAGDRNDLSDGAPDEPSNAENDDLADAFAYSLRVDVFPADSALEAADGSAISLLPQTFRYIYTNGNAGVLSLQHPVDVEGVVTAYRATPTARALPGAEEPLQGVVRLLRPGTVQSRSVATDDQGSFATMLVPGTGYNLVIEPDDASLPTWAAPLSVLEGTSLDLQLSTGSALWGDVLDDAGQPVAGATVYAQSPLGATTPSVRTDAQGAFQLQVSPGEWRLVTEGPTLGRDPVLTDPYLEVSDTPIQHDVLYPRRNRVTVSGRVIPANGEAIRDGRARFTALSLDGYPSEASLQIEVRADAFGNFEARLLQGTWTVELYPADNQGLTPVRLDDLVVSANTSLGEVSLPTLVPVFGSLVDPVGVPVADALVDCREPAFAGRHFTTRSNDEGGFAFATPRTPLHCDIVPPSSRSDLALTRRTFNAEQNTSPTLALDAGVPLQGTAVIVDGDDEQALDFAVIEVRDDAGTLLATGITGLDGRFDMRVVLP